MRRFGWIVFAIAGSGFRDKAVEPPKPVVEAIKPSPPQSSELRTIPMPAHPELVVTVPGDVKPMEMVDGASVTMGADDFAIVFTPAPPKTLADAKADIPPKLVIASEELPDGWSMQRRWPDPLHPEKAHDVIEVQRKIGGVDYRCTVTAFEPTRLAALRDICTSIRPAR
jgi:hypothetical protein